MLIYLFYRWIRTKDDLTKETIAASLDEELVYDEKALALISTLSVHRGTENKKQALVLNGTSIK